MRYQTILLKYSGFKTFSLFKMGYEIFLIVWNYPPSWYPGLKMITPVVDIFFNGR